MSARMDGWHRGSGQLPLPGPRALAERTFRQPDLPGIRRFAAAYGARAGIEAGQHADFVLAVSEAAACALAYGPCTARLRLWTAGTRALGEICADGMLFGQGPGDVRQDGAGTLRRWLLRQLCDHVSVEPGPHRVTVRFSMALT
jgi:hypothetical protein